MKKVIVLVTLVGMYVGNLYTMTPAQVLESLRTIDTAGQEVRQELQEDIAVRQRLLTKFRKLEIQLQPALDSYKEDVLSLVPQIVEEIVARSENHAQTVHNLKDQQEMLEKLSSKEFVQELIRQSEETIKSITERLVAGDAYRNEAYAFLYAAFRGDESVKTFDIRIFDQMCKEDKEKRKEHIKYLRCRLSVLQHPFYSKCVQEQYVKEEGASVAESQEAMELAKAADREEIQKSIADGKANNRILKAVRAYMVQD